MDYDNPKVKPAQHITEPFSNIMAQATRIKAAQQVQNESTITTEIFVRDDEDEYDNSPQNDMRNYQEEEYASGENYDDYEREFRKPKDKNVVEEVSMPLPSPASLDDVGTTVGTLKVLTLDEFLGISLPPREMIVAPFLPSQGLVMIAAARGVGKTHVALGIAYAITTGSIFLKWSATGKPRPVLYLDGEMPATLFQERLQLIVQMNGGKKPAPDLMHIVTPDKQDRVMPDLSTSQGRQEVEPLIERVEVVIIDNISSLFRKGNENEAETWQAAQDWALDWRRRGKSIIFIHHTGRNGRNPRGNSKREDILDTVMILHQPADYDPSEGARFEIHFTKARHFRGDDATPFEAHLTEDNGKSVWKTSSLAPDALTEDVAELFNAGNTIKQIGQALELTKSKVETQLKHTRKQGIITR